MQSPVATVVVAKGRGKSAAATRVSVHTERNRVVVTVEYRMEDVEVA
jgi:hypothetical protein